ncbi:MAG: general stress protein CsbD [Bacteroidales bacterium]|nr:general stress protein CsbD [Bacteroidales bacterium]
MEKEFDVYYWNSLKGKLKENYPILTNSDLLWRQGTEEDLLRTIAFKLGKTKRQLQEIIENY